MDEKRRNDRDAADGLIERGSRPGPDTCGIDIFATSVNAGWPLEVVPGADEPYHRYALVLVD